MDTPQARGGAGELATRWGEYRRRLDAVGLVAFDTNAAALAAHREALAAWHARLAVLQKWGSDLSGGRQPSE